MNILYLLVSNEADTYLEQTVLSVESLKKHMTDARVTVLIDEGTEKTLVNGREKLRGVSDNIIVATVPSDLNQKNISRYLKTTMYQYMNDDFLFIDGDTIICEPLDDIPKEYPLAAVVDLHLTISDCPLRSRLEDFANKAGYHAGFDDRHYNSGVLWVKKCDISKRFFDQWHILWKEALSKGLTQDQTSFNEVNYRMNGVIHELNGIWNCQMRRYGTGFQFVYDAKIIHYFASNFPGTVPYDLANEAILRCALNDVYPDELKHIIESPKGAFRGLKYTVSDSITREIVESRAVELLRLLYEKHNKIYKRINGIIDFFVKGRKALRR